MPKPTKGPRLGGSSSHQKALLANLATSLFEHGRIKTTEPKARALRPYAEKLITHAKKGALHNRREVLKNIRDKDVVHALFAEIGPFFADRDGGYTRIIKVEARKGDNAPMAVIELVREKTVTSEADRARRVKASKKTARKQPDPWRQRRQPQAAVEPEAAVGPTAEETEEAQVEEAQAEEAQTEEARPTSLKRRPRISEDVRLRLDIAYDGTDFAGWAVQAGQRTVAGVLDEALTTVFRTPVRLHAAGRTDAGVHATGQVAHADVPVDALPNAYARSPRPLDPEFMPLLRRLGGFLPADVRVLDIARAPAGFDSRFSALRRHYQYRLSTAPYGVGPAAGPLHHRLAAPPGCGRDDGRVARTAGVARLCSVLPSARRRHHDSRSAAAGLVARRRRGHRARHRRRVLLVDGALPGRGAAGRRGTPAHGRMVSRIAHCDRPFQ